MNFQNLDILPTIHPMSILAQKEIKKSVNIGIWTIVYGYLCIVKWNFSDGCQNLFYFMEKSLIRTEHVLNLLV